MTNDRRLEPPKLGVAILNRLADRNEPLAGDLIEGFQIKRSRVWFWRQLIGAILTGAFRRLEIRPIKLVDFPSWQQPHEDFETKRRRLQTLGLSASPVGGVSGWTIVAIIYLISTVQPVLWVLLSLGLLAGGLIGWMRVRRSQRHGGQADDELTTIVLFPHHVR